MGSFPTLGNFSILPAEVRQMIFQEHFNDRSAGWKKNRAAIFRCSEDLNIEARQVLYPSIKKAYITVNQNHKNDISIAVAVKLGDSKRGVRKDPRRPPPVLDHVQTVILNVTTNSIKTHKARIFYDNLGPLYRLLDHPKLKTIKLRNIELDMAVYLMGKIENPLRTRDAMFAKDVLRVLLLIKNPIVFIWSDGFDRRCKLGRHNEALQAWFNRKIARHEIKCFQLGPVRLQEPEPTWFLHQ